MSGDAWTSDDIEELERSGEWLADERWRAPAYLANSPFSAEEHESIFAALALMYPPRRARLVATRATASDRFLPADQPPLFDPWAAHASPAVALGADLAVVRPWAAPRCRDLIDGLVRNPPRYAGSRLELEVHAALLRAEIDVERGKKLDLRASLGGTPVMIEVRLVNFGDGADAEAALLNHVQLGWSQGRGHGVPRCVPGHVSLLAAVRDLPEQQRLALLRDDATRDALRQKVLAAADQLLVDGRDSVTVDGIVRVERLQGDATNFGSCPPADVARETKRLLDILRDKADQVRKHAEGDAVIWLDIGIRLGVPTLYLPAIQEWLTSTDGEVGQRIVGVVLVAEYFAPEMVEVLKWPYLVPHGRLAPDLGPPEAWRAIWGGLNWFRLRRAIWRHDLKSAQ